MPTTPPNAQGLHTCGCHTEIMSGQVTPTNFWRKPAVIGIGAGVLTVLVLGGVATAIGVSMTADTKPAQPTETLTASPGAETHPVPPPPAAPTTQPARHALSDAESLRSAIIAAVDAAAGIGATEIEVEINGYDVEVQRADGTEAEVFVTLDGSTTVRDEDDDDDDPLINLDQLPDLVRIALDTAGGGVVEKISTDDDDDHFYDVDVRLDTGAEVEIEFDANLAVIEVNRD